MPSSEVIQEVAAEIAEMLDPYASEHVRLVQKGIMLYRQGSVSQLKINEADVVTAVVQDVIPVRVELDLTFFGMSLCSCPEDGLCRHELAAFFALYAKIGSVAEWMEKWREPVRKNGNPAGWNILRAADLLKLNQNLKPDYGRWVESTTKSFEVIMKSRKYSNAYMVAELFELYLQRLRAGSPSQPEWRLLYKLVTNVISFIQLARLSEELGHSEANIGRSYLHVFHNLIDEAEQLVTMIDQHTLPFDFEAFIEKFPKDAAQLLTCTPKLEFERTYLYRLLWQDFFKKRTWREEESERLAGELKNWMEWENPVPLIIAGIQLHLLLDEDEQALDMLRRTDDAVIVPYLLYWIDDFTLAKNWKRVGPLIDCLLSKIRGYLADLVGYQSCSRFTALALKAIAPYCHETGKADWYERAMMQTLPYSFNDYEYVLFNRGQYDKWAELYSFVGISYADIPKSRIKIVEKEQPEVLLGLLHQTVQREIDLKNRQSYRIAVRHLKKLRTLYKKVKRVDDWQFFFDTLLKKTKRLRAFHEECKRSKLIDA